MPKAIVRHTLLEAISPSRLRSPAPRSTWKLAAVSALLLRATGAVVPLGSEGCLATIQEKRIYGPSWPVPNARPQVLAERRTSDPAVHAVSLASRLDVAVTRDTECRDVVVAQKVRTVDIRRFFADNAQDRNGALVGLLGGGVGLLAYAADQAQCSTACSSAIRTADYALLGAAAIPLAFLAYNAFRVQDASTLELLPEALPGAWAICSTEALSDEEVTVSLPGGDLQGRTGASGHATFDLSGLRTGSGDASRAVVHRAGSADVSIDLTPVGASPTPLP